MDYKTLESEYDKLFADEVLPFIQQRIGKDFKTVPVFHLLEGLHINRFRSSLPLMIAKLYGRNERQMLPLAAFCEITFATAMAQDDFYDDDAVREGLAAAHTVFGVTHTLLACDYVNHQAITLLEEGLSWAPASTRAAVLSVANAGMAAWYQSVQMELASKKDLLAVDENYLNTLYLAKTIHGRMLLECVFLLVQDDPGVVETMRLYAEHLALAGQLKNDIYDFVKHKPFRGLSDLRQGHITWPLFLALQSSDHAGKKAIVEALSTHEYDKLTMIYKDELVFERMLHLIDFHVETAKRIIAGKFPDVIASLLETWAEGNRTFSKEPKL